MSKLLGSVLDKISENNNEYRSYLRSLNSLIEELTTNYVGEVVASTNYTLDFSDSVNTSKDKIVSPVMKTIESYVIKDLRSVETVNEQFIEKINDKLENANINTREEKEAFMNNLNNLLNNKYLEIIKIKRVSFNNEEGKNDDIESSINEFIEYVKQNASVDDSKLVSITDKYKDSVYTQINSTLLKISDLYLNNFTSEVSSSLNGAIDFEETNDSFLNIPEVKVAPEIKIENTLENKSISEVEIPEVPMVPNISSVPEIPVVPEVPMVSDNNTFISDISKDDNTSSLSSIDDLNDITSSVEEVKEEQPNLPKEEIKEDEQQEITLKDIVNEQNRTNESLEKVVEEEKESPIMEIKPINPIEVSSDKEEPKKRPLDVEEILKIAKSPILDAPSIKSLREDKGYTEIKPMVKEEEKDTFDDSFDEEEITKEMIKRLNDRLLAIKERQDRYDEEKAKLLEDEKFVNDLIESSNKKKEELDALEEELDNKESELNKREKELEEKINGIMPFANAVMDAQKES